MKSSFIKVCGIQNQEEALGCLAAGANTLGLLLGLTHLADDKITLEAAQGIVAAVPPVTRTVMVTHLLSAAEIARMAGSAGVTSIQIHDDLPVEGVLQLRQMLPTIELIKAVHVTGDEALKKAKQYAPHVDFLLLDSRTKDRLGGTGLVHDWDLSASIVRAVGIPVILAGGLNPENVEAAIAKVRPAGIDANSGLETVDARKDYAKVRNFAVAGQRCLGSLR
jgi:phosphoribosylanthranilate isomerase